MKTIFTKTLTKEEIKAIRIIKGFNSDLRIKLKHIDKDSIWYFIDNNRLGLLGTEFGIAKPDPTDEDWIRYERCLDRMVEQVINGR